MQPLRTTLISVGLTTALGGILLACGMPAFSQDDRHHAPGQHHSSPISPSQKRTEAEVVRDREAERFLNQGLDQLHRGEKEAALKSLTRALELAPNHDGTYTYRGDLYYALGRYPEAIADYSRAIESNRDFSYLYNRRGNAYEAVKDYKSALKDFNKSIELYPEQGATYRNRGSAYYKSGIYSAALKDLNQAVQLNPNLADAYQMRGEIHAKLGKRQEAITDFQQASQLFANQGNIQNSEKVDRLVQELRKQAASRTAPAAIAP